MDGEKDFLKNFEDVFGSGRTASEMVLIKRVNELWAEMERLRERVRELEEGIKLHKGLMEQDEHEIYAADEELWRLIDKQEGGGDEL